MFEWNGLIPDWPPSPKTETDQLPELKACVPLSCVPPSRSLSGSAGLSDTLWYWSVPSPWLSVLMEVGIFDSHMWQSVRSVPVRPRVSHWLEAFVNEPLSLQTPPSFAMKTLFGLNGVAAIPCWSGWRLRLCWASIVMSVKSTPASCERWTARPFDGRLAVKISLYCIAPPM